MGRCGPVRCRLAKLRYSCCDRPRAFPSTPGQTIANKKGGGGSRLIWDFPQESPPQLGPAPRQARRGHVSLPRCHKTGSAAPPLAPCAGRPPNGNRHRRDAAPRPDENDRGDTGPPQVPTQFQRAHRRLSRSASWICGSRGQSSPEALLPRCRPPA